MIRFICPECQSQLKANNNQAGNNIRCPKCHTRIIIPAITDTNSSPDSLLGQPGVSADAPVEWEQYLASERRSKLVPVAVSAVFIFTAILIGGLIIWIRQRPTQQVASTLPPATTAAKPIDTTNSYPIRTPSSHSPDGDTRKAIESQRKKTAKPGKKPPVEEEELPKPLKRLPTEEEMPESENKRAPVPVQDELAKAEERVKGVFKEDFAKKQPEAMRALARKLCEQAGETKDDPAARFVLLREAQELFAKAGDFQSAFQTIDQLVADYSVEKSDLKVAVLETAASSANSIDEARGVAEAALAAIAESLSLGDPIAVRRFLAVAKSVTKKSQSKQIPEKIRAAEQDLREYDKDLKEMQTAAKILSTRPEDASANLIAGKYFCFYKRDWKKGLPMLAKCSDQGLRSVAIRELAKPLTATAQLEIADAWYDIAQHEPHVRQVACLRRSLEWYDQLTMLSGFSKTRVEKRRAEVDRLLPECEKAWRVAERRRKQTILRWQLKFTFAGAADYLKQLDMLGAFVAFPNITGKVVVIRNLRERPAKPKSENLKAIDRPWFFDTDIQFIKSVADELKLDFSPTYLVILVPHKVEKELLEKELRFRNRKVEEIDKTTFSISIKNGKPIIKVIDQSVKGSKP